MSELDASVLPDTQVKFENLNQLQLLFSGQQLDFLHQLQEETHQTLTADNKKSQNSQQKQ